MLGKHTRGLHDDQLSRILAIVMNTRKSIAVGMCMPGHESALLSCSSQSYCVLSYVCIRVLVMYSFGHLLARCGHVAHVNVPTQPPLAIYEVQESDQVSERRNVLKLACQVCSSFVEEPMLAIERPRMHTRVHAYVVLALVKGWLHLCDHRSLPRLSGSSAGALQRTRFETKHAMPTNHSFRVKNSKDGDLMCL